MAWILEHLQIILFVAGAIAYWLNQRAREKAGEQADYDGDGIPEVPSRRFAPPGADGADPEQDERVRRIQEEIRRKIAERQGRPPETPAAPVPEFDPLRDLVRPVFGEEPIETPPLRAEPTPPPPVLVSSFAPDQAALERQRRLAEELEELENRRAAARHAVDSVKRASAYDFPSPEAGPALDRGDNRAGASLRESLGSPRAMRRVMALREILDRPVALR